VAELAIRAALTGLLCFAAAEEEVLLAGVAGDSDEGGAERWSARVTIIHNSDFRDEQVQRLLALREGRTPPEFPRVEHGSPELYAGYEARGAHALSASRGTTAALVDELARACDDDLLDPTRHPWLRGRHLWLQIVVRGFWHPTGHVGEYYLRHGLPDRALGLHAQAVATARYLGAPGPALGMAHYSLACTQALTGLIDDSRASLAEAISLNQDLREHAARDPDLESLKARTGS